MIANFSVAKDMIELLKDKNNQENLVKLSNMASQGIDLHILSNACSFEKAKNNGESKLNIISLNENQGATKVYANVFDQLFPSKLHEITEGLKAGFIKEYFKDRTATQESLNYALNELVNFKAQGKNMGDLNTQGKNMEDLNNMYNAQKEYDRFKEFQKNNRELKKSRYVENLKRISEMRRM